MLLSELLRPELIKTNLDAESRREAIGELVDLLVQRHEIGMSHRTEVLDAIMKQEGQLSSGLEKGVAVPHAISDRAEDLICALGVSRRGVDFSSRDGSLAQIIVLVLAPKKNFAGEIRTLAGVQHLFSHETLREQILSASSGLEAYEMIQREEQGVEA